MANANESVFTFDTTPFMDSLNKMEKSVSKAAHNLAGIGKTIEQAVGGAIAKAARSVAGLAAGVFSVNAALKAMPAIGKSFEVMKDILTRNLFYPLYKEIIPVLNNMLKWVTDHRALFLQWGAVIRNVVIAVADVVEKLYQGFKKLASAVFSGLKDALGLQTDSFDEVLNILVLKMYVMLIYVERVAGKIMATLGPLVSWLVKQIVDIATVIGDWALELGTAIVETGLFNAALETMKSLFTGIKNIAIEAGKGIKDFIMNMITPNDYGDNLTTVLTTIRQIWDEFSDLFATGLSGFFEGFNSTSSNLLSTIQPLIDSIKDFLKEIDKEELKESMKKLGAVVGTSLVLTFGALAIAIDTVISGMRQLFALLDGNMEKFIEIGEQWAQRTKFVATVMEDAIEKAGNVINSESSINRMGRRLAGPENMSVIDKARELGIPITNDKTIEQLRFEIGKKQEEMGTSVDDALITSKGDVIRLNPNDNVYAFQGNPKAGGQPINLTFGDTIINATVTEGDASQAGQNFALVYGSEFAQRISEQLYREGY